jgi:chemotaxis protein MotB
MRRGTKGGAKGRALDPNAWMVTFSDLLMLLLTFFVMLLSISSMDAKRLKQMLSHIQEAAGLLEFSGLKEVTSLAEFVRKHQLTDDNFMIDQNLLKDLLLPPTDSEEEKREAMKDLSQMISVTDDERGIVFSLQGDIFFDPGQATLKKAIFKILDSIATAIDACATHILIMGHTDNMERAGTAWESNQELSLYRGLAVLEYFLKEKGLSPSRFSAGGYGSSMPLHPNDTAKNRALNRRVEIIIQHL